MTNHGQSKCAAPMALAGRQRIFLVNHSQPLVSDVEFVDQAPHWTLGDALAILGSVAHKHHASRGEMLALGWRSIAGRY